MPRPEFSEARFLHSAGFIQLCRDAAAESSDKRFLSCGTDGDVWVWDTASSLEEGDDVDHKRISDRTHHAIAWHGADIYIGHTAIDFATNIEKQVVGRMTFPDFTSESPIANFSLDVSTLDVSKSGRLVAAGATDFTIKCIDRTDVNEYKRFECEGPILCVVIDPKEEFLASSSTDGFFRIWALTGDVSDGRQSVKAIKLLPHFGDLDIKKTRAQMCWTKDGSFVAVPCAGKVVLIERATWAQKRTFTVQALANETFSISTLSSCGQYLAASTLEGHICVWDINSGQLLSSSHYRRDGQAKTISSMTWHPAIKDQLVFCDIDEHMCSLMHCLSSSDVPEAASHRASLLEEDDDIDDFIGQPLRKRSALLDDDEDSKASADLGAIKARFGFSQDGVQLPVDFSGQSTRPSAVSSLLAPAWRPPTLPKAFVSGSTPTNLSQRYLKWNDVGVIRMFNTDDESSIEIEFHDVSIHPAIAIDNSDTNYTIGDMSAEAVVLAAPGIIEEKCR
uniref:Minichromosome loss protein Mcl1 middle region domain-containing protein n=1 Tax=Plectus sambesii TaxID=2011161 RepID=A0A914XF36_9BILA